MIYVVFLPKSLLKAFWFKNNFYNSFENRTFVRSNLKDLLLMEIFIKASQFILSLSLLIVLHELGHFIPAKLFKNQGRKVLLIF